MVPRNRTGCLLHLFLFCALSASASSPVVPESLYVRGLRAQQQGHWIEALAAYQELALAGNLEPSVLRLVAARWVRADLEVQRLIASEALRGVPGDQWEFLLLPFEPVGRGDPPEVRALLEELGAAAAWWLERSLISCKAGRPVPLVSALLVHGALRGSASASRLLREAGAAAQEVAPPVNTLPGVLFRLSRLEPAGPPPWEPGGTVPEHYWKGGNSEERGGKISKAIAHFQYEHGLEPTGALDAATRAALEGAYREMQAKGGPVLEVPGQPAADPAAVAARRLGTRAYLAATMSLMEDGSMAWSAVWMDTSGTEVLSQPLAGRFVLAAGSKAQGFEAGWKQMISAIISAVPGATRTELPADCMEKPMSLIRTRAAGRALLDLAEGRRDAAQEAFRRVVGASGGGVDWYAEGWSMEELEMELAEDAFLGRPIPRLERLRGLVRRLAALHSSLARAGPTSAGALVPPLLWATREGTVVVEGRVP